MAEPGQINKIREYMKRAVDSLKRAQDCLNDEKYIDLVSFDAYWAAYDSIEAMALFKGKRVPEYYSLIAFLDRELIRPRLINEDIGQKFRQLFKQHLIKDNKAHPDIVRKHAAKNLQDATIIVSEVKQWLTNSIEDFDVPNIH